MRWAQGSGGPQRYEVFRVRSVSAAAALAVTWFSTSVDAQERVEGTPTPTADAEASEPYRPKFGVNGAFGLAFGGDDLVTAEYDNGEERTLSAGTGVILSVGATATPLWAGPVGFGVGVDLGWKYTQLTAENGTLSLERFPVVGSLHTLFHVGGSWYLLAAGGVHHELGVSISGDGVFDGISADPESSLGFMGEIGALYGKRGFGVDATLRYTTLEYEANGDTADASNFGFFTGVHYNW